MERYAKMFQNTHKNGVVSHITDYSFRYSETTKMHKIFLLQKRLFI